MNPDAFHLRMMRLDEQFQSGALARALDTAQCLRTELRGAAVLDGGQCGWVLYYELRALHALERWSDALHLAAEQHAMLVSLPVANQAFAASLAMECAARAGRRDRVAVWAERCIRARMRDQDPQSALLAVRTALALAEETNRTDLEARLGEVLACAAEAFGQQDRLQQLLAHAP